MKSLKLALGHRLFAWGLRLITDSSTLILKINGHRYIGPEESHGPVNANGSRHRATQAQAARIRAGMDRWASAYVDQHAGNQVADAQAAS